MKERSDQDDKRLTKEERQREGHAMQNEKTRQSATSPLSGRPSQRKGSVGTDNQVTAAAELLGIARNISERMKSVKRNLHQRQQEISIKGSRKISIKGSRKNPQKQGKTGHFRRN